jgi:hypothetical protein
MKERIVSLKIIISTHGETKAIIHSQIEEGQLRDYSLETGEYELTIIVEGVKDEEPMLRDER